MSTEVKVAVLPPCDTHELLYGFGSSATAEYDAKTKLGPWGNMCQGCFDVLGIGLGTGLGQHLVLDKSYLVE